MFTRLASPGARAKSTTRPRANRARLHGRRREERRMLFEQFEPRVVLAATLHAIAAANLDVVQHDAGNNTTSVTVTAPLAINDFQVRSGSNRGDYNVQIGIDAAVDSINGILMTSVRENGRDNTAAGDVDPNYTGLQYATSAIQGSSSGYYIPVFNTSFSRSGTSYAGGYEFNMNVAGAWFPYAEGWLGGFVYNLAGTNGGPNDTFLGNTDLELATHVIDLGGGKTTVDLRALGINAQTDGVLLVNGAKNEDNYALSMANADGTWTIFCHDNGANGSSYEQDYVGFVYVPASDNTVVAGKFLGDLTAPIATRAFTVTNPSSGNYRLTIPGYTPDDGVLIISAEGGVSANVDNVVSYRADGNSWLIQTRDLPNVGLQNMGATEPVVSFVFIPAPEDAGITVAPTSGLLTTESGSTDAFAIILDRQPAADVTINLSSSNTSEGTVSPASITFTPDNWFEAQMVTVTGVDDLVSDGTKPYTVITSAPASDDADYNGIDPADVTAVNVDNDTIGVTIDPTGGLITTEADGMDTFQVILQTQPAADVTITFTSDDLTEGEVPTDSITFTPVNWSEPQIVTVAGLDDFTDDGDVTYTISATVTSADANYDGMAVNSVAVINLDNDTAGISVSPSTGLTTSEAGVIAEFSVVLASEPIADVVVSLASSDTSEGTVSSDALTFTAANWNVPQAVTITGQDDLVGDGDIAYSILTSITSGDAIYAAIDPSDVAATNLDNEPWITLSGSSLSYGVGDPAVGVDGRATVTDPDTADYDGGSLTVTLALNATAADCLAIRHDGTAAGKIGVSGSDVTYGGTSIGTFAGGIGVAPLVVTLNSAATPEAVQALLRAITFHNVSAYPSLADRTVTISLADGDGGTSNLVEKKIEFSVVRTVQFQEGVDHGYGTYAGQADIELYQGGPDIAYPAGVNASEGLLVDYDAGTVNAQVLLRFEDLFGNDPGQIPHGAVILSATLTVDTNNPGDGGTIHRMLVPWDAESDTWNSFGNGSSGRNATPAVQADNVEAVAINQSQVGTVDGASDTGTGPTHIGVTADLQAWSDGAANLGWAMIGWPLRADGWAFSPGESATADDRPQLTVQWMLAGTGSASFRQDVDGYWGAQDTMLLQEAPGDDQSLATSLFVDAANASNETQVLLKFLNIIGDGANLIPAGSLVHAAVLTLASTVPDAMGDGGQLFTMLTSWYDFSANWSLFTDGIQANGVEASVESHTQAGTADRYPNVQATFNTFDVTADVQAWVSGTLANNGWAILPWPGGTDGWGFASSDAIENERPQLRVYYTPPGITVQPTEDLLTTESGETAEFTVVLDTAPSADVTIAVTSSDTLEGTVSVSELTFTPANWNVPQTVTVSGVDDAFEDGDIAYTVYLDPAESDDPAYDGLDPEDVAAVNVDDDSPGVLIQPTDGLVVTEAGGTATFTAVLKSKPTANVTLALSSDDATEGTVSPTSFTFTPTNWYLRQTATVTGVNDFRIDGDVSFHIVTTATSSDPIYNVPVDDVEVTNLDDDVAGVTFTPSGGLVTTETGGTDTFTAVLDTEPTRNVTINLTSNDTTEGSVSPTSVTFSPTNWNTPQTVTVTGLDDAEDDNDIAYAIVTTIFAGPMGDPNYSSLNPDDLSVTNVDDENAAPVVTLPNSSVHYGIGTSGIGIDSMATVVDTDPTDYAAGTLTVTLTNGTADDRLVVRNDGSGAGEVGVAGSDVTFEGLVVGTWSGGAGTTPLVVTFTDRATPTIAQAVLRAVTFSNVNAAPDTTPRGVGVVVTDGQGGTSNTASKTIELGLKRVTAFQQGVDWGYGPYAGAADIQLFQSRPDTPQPQGGDGYGLLVDYDGGTANSQVLLRFDDLIGNGPGQIPVGAQIISAQLLVDTNNPGDGGTLHRMLTTWDAETETWKTFGNGVAPRNTTPGVQANDAEARVAFDSQVATSTDNTAPTGSGTISIGVTADVQAWAAGATNLGWAMIGWQGNTDGWAFSPSEATNPADRPLLYIEWIPSDTASQSFRQGADGYTGTVDTQLAQASPDTSYATNTVVWIDAEDPPTPTHPDPYNNASQTLLRFNDIIGNGLSQIPAGSTIHAAVLTLSSVVSNAMGDGGTFHAMRTPWSDTDTWNSLTGGVSADDVEASATYNTSAGSAALDPDVQGGFNPFDVTADVQAWVNGTLDNYGWAMLPWLGGNNGWGIGTAEATLEKYRPELRVYFTAGPGVTVDPVSSLVATEDGATQTIRVVLNTVPTADVVITITADPQTEVSVDGGTTFVSAADLTFTPGDALTPQSVIVRAVDDSVVEGDHTGGLSFTVTSDDARYSGAVVHDLSVAITDNDMVMVEQVVINDGSEQRSMVTELTVMFNSAVTIAADAFQVVNRDTLETVVTSFTTTVDIITGKTVAVIRFESGASVEDRPIGNTLADGNYQLTIDATKVTVHGMQLDGDADGTAGGDFAFGEEAADDFFRLFGDANGNGEVDGLDLYFEFLPSYGAEAGDPGYRAEFDWDGNGELDGLDAYFHLLPNYGKERDLSGF